MAIMAVKAVSVAVQRGGCEGCKESVRCDACGGCDDFENCKVMLVTRG